jgi:hypothetical protein
MITLSKDQHDELANNGQDSARVLDPVTNTEYVLLRADVFAQLSEMITDDFEASDAYAAIDEAFAEGWNHPKMSDYDRYEDFKK